MTTTRDRIRPVIEDVWVEESTPEGRIAAKVPMRRDPRTGELSYTATAMRTLDRLRAIATEVGQASTPGHIRSLRDALGFTQRQIAQRLRVTEQTVSRWERGDSQPNAEAIARLRRLQSEARKKGIAVKQKSRSMP